MRILFCIGSMNQGGAERVIANLSNELSKKNEISIVSTIKGDPFYNIEKRIKYYTLDSDYLRKNLIHRTIKRTRKLRRIIKVEKPDVIISFLPEPTFRLLVAKIFLNIKTIISVRNDPNMIYNTFIKKLIVKVLYPMANGFVFQTEDAKKWFSKRIQIKSRVIPNPINEQFICQPYEGIREKSIVCVARLVKQKNHKMLINAFDTIVKEHPDYTLKLYGDGPCRESLISQTEKLGLKSKILFMGKVKNLKDEIYNASMFVLPSNYEGMPNALMEAMALGLPCIATDCPCGGPKFLINNRENGFLLNVGDKKRLIELINYIIENKDLAQKIGNKAHEISYKLLPDKIYKEWEEYILEVSNEK